MLATRGVEFWQLNAPVDFFLVCWPTFLAQFLFERPREWRPCKRWSGPPPCRGQGARFGATWVAACLASGCLVVAGRGGVDPPRRAAPGALPGSLFCARILGSESGPKMCTRTVGAQVLVSVFGPGIWAHFRACLWRPFCNEGAAPGCSARLFGFLFAGCSWALLP